MTNRITAVTPIRADKYLFVRIETDDGRVGVGEAGAWSHIEATATVLEKFGDYLRGEDASRIEHHWQVLTRFGSYSGAIVMAAVSAIDVALWDLKGQRLGAPIHDLLGGLVRDRVRVYAQARGHSRAALVAHCRQLAEAGFTAIGHVNPFLDEDPALALGGSLARRLDAAVETLEEVVAALGPDVDVAVELHRRLRPAEAIQFGQRIAHLSPLFLEDPIAPGSVEAMADVQRSLTLPVATGERIFGLDGFHQLLQSGGARYIRPCLSLCGGLTGGLRIAALAQAYKVDVVPHVTYSPIAVATALHFAAVVPNVLILEYPTARYLDDQATDGLIGAEMVEGAPVHTGGMLTPGRAPGLGTTLVADIATRHPIRSIPVDMRRRDDGSPIEH